MRRWFRSTSITVPVETFYGHDCKVSAMWFGPDGIRDLKIATIADGEYTRIIGLPMAVPEGVSLKVCVDGNTVTYKSGPVDLSYFYDTEASKQM